MRRFAASSMKCAPFWDDSAKSTPLLARIDREALDPREAADSDLAVELLELVEPAAVDDPGDQLARIDLLRKSSGIRP